MNKLLTLIIIISSSILLTGCGSKNKVAAVAGTTFTDWASYKSGQVIKGIGGEITSGSEENSVPIKRGISTAATSVILETDASNDGLDKITNTIDGRTNVFDLTTATLSAVDVNNNEYLIYGYGTGENRPIFITGQPAIDEQTWKYEYQNYGAWMNEVIAGVSIGAISAGAPTSNLPTTSSATYTGEYTGVYINDVNSVDAVTVGDVSLVANFATNTIALSTSNHFIKPILENPTSNSVASNDFLVPPDTSQAFSGTLNISTTTNYFNGQASNGVGGISGEVKGQFYGPLHQEVGGVFDLDVTDINDNVIQHIGSFGAKK